jgi:hypothetical protein
MMNPATFLVEYAFQFAPEEINWIRSISIFGTKSIRVRGAARLNASSQEKTTPTASRIHVMTIELGAR